MTRRRAGLDRACARVPVTRFWGTRARSASVMTALPGSLTPVTQGLGRVLVVDDDEVIRQLIAVNLTLEGFEVFTAVDGQDCLDRVEDVKPDVITLDVMMPRLDGWVTATQLRRNPSHGGNQGRPHHRPRAGGRQGPRPAGRRRRVPDQAVRPGRDDPRGPRAGRSPEHRLRLRRHDAARSTADAAPRSPACCGPALPRGSWPARAARSCQPRAPGGRRRPAIGGGAGSYATSLPLALASLTGRTAMAGGRDAGVRAWRRCRG